MYNLMYNLTAGILIAGPVLQLLRKSCQLTQHCAVDSSNAKSSATGSTGQNLLSLIDIFSRVHMARKSKIC